uniref:Uncharacterized protein n=1 Tax=Lotus japonicus TaxID=34305 RepID=I3SFU7_LOTJA|nr:unknown [Lotus japonicus]
MVSLILFVRSSSLLFLYHLQVSVASSSFVLLFSIASFSVVVLRRAIAHHRRARVVLGMHFCLSHSLPPSISHTAILFAS